MSKTVTYFYADGSNADAVERAKQAAADKGYTVDKVVRVVYSERPTGWLITLVIRDRATVA